jgi:HD-GYP domain-containing protein (c-di-GMP phosphodiesterase class II)
VSALRDSVTRAEIAPVLLEVVSSLVKADGAALTTSDGAELSGNWAEPCGDSSLSSAEAGDRMLKVEIATGCWKRWEGDDLEVGNDLYRQLVVERLPYENPAIDENLPDLPVGWKDGLRGLVSVPLIAQGEAMGVLWVGCRQEFPQDENLEGHLRVLVAIADIAASALHHAMLFEVTQQRVHHLTALRTIDRAITCSLDLQLTLNVLLDQLMNQKEIDAVDILLVDPFTHQMNYAGGRGLRGRIFDGSQQRMGESLAGQVVLERKAIDLPDLRGYPRSYNQKAAFLGEGLTAYLGVPLITKGEVLGVLEILRRTAKEVDLEWLDFIESMASQVAIAIHNAELFEKLQRTNLDILQSYDATIDSWTRAMERRKIEDRGHTDRLVWWTTMLGRELGVSENDLTHLRRGAILHDIGKLALPDSILLKPGPLTGQELIHMRRHPVYSFEWLSPVIYLHHALDIPYCHHESWDGNGYPRGLKGLQIPFSARIFSVADSWDSLCSDRPYRKAWKQSLALEYIRDMSGVRFDPTVVEVFLRVASQEPAELRLEQL